MRRQIPKMAKQVGKTIVREPLEILKTAGEQVGVRQQERVSGGRQEVQKVEPSIEEKRKERRITAHRWELEEMIAQKRQERAQRQMLARGEEETKRQEKRMVEQEKKESFVQKILKKFQRRVEGPKLPQAT